MFGDAQSNHFLGGIFLFLFSIIFIILFGIFSTNCDNTVCTIPATTMLQLTNIRYAIWIPTSLLLVLGVYMIAGVRNNKLMITNKTVIGLWCNIFPIISLTLLVSSCLLYSIINADGFNCGDATPSKSSKIAYSDLHVSLFHMVTGMITMSGVLFCISVYTLYDFWRETDEQKIEKAKNAISQFDKIKTLSPGGSPKPDIKNDLTKLKKALEEGATINKDNDLEYYNKITEIEDYLVKSDALKEAKEKAIRDIEMSKLVKNSEQQSKSLSAITAQRIVAEFDKKEKDAKIDEICKYTKSSTPEDKYIYEALQKTEFYQKNKDLIVATCGGEQAIYLYKTLKQYKEAQAKQDILTILQTIEKVCKSNLEGKYRTEFFNEVNLRKEYFWTNFQLDITRACEHIGPPGTKKLFITDIIEKHIASQSPVQAPPGQASPVQAPPGQPYSPASIPQSGAVNIPLKLVSEESEDSELAKGSQPQQAPVMSAVDTNCSRLARSAGQSSDRTGYICDSLGDESNTGMSDENIVNCLRKNKLINDEKTLLQLKRECNVLSPHKIKAPGIDFESMKNPKKLFEVPAKAVGVAASDDGFDYTRARKRNVGDVMSLSSYRSVNAKDSTRVRVEGEPEKASQHVKDEYTVPPFSDNPFNQTIQPEDGEVLHFLKPKKIKTQKPKNTKKH